MLLRNLYRSLDQTKNSFDFIAACEKFRSSSELAEISTGKQLIQFTFSQMREWILLVNEIG